MQSEEMTDPEHGRTAPGEPVEEPAERSADQGHDNLEAAATVLLGLAALLIAWSVYQSGLWDGRQAAAQTMSVNTTTESVDELQIADTTKALDQTLFIEMFTSGSCDDEGGDDFVCDQIFANMSPEGEAAVNAWFDNDDLVPVESEAYLDALYAEGNELAEEGVRFFEEAGQANQNGDDYDLASTVLTLVVQPAAYLTLERRRPGGERMAGAA